MSLKEQADMKALKEQVSILKTFVSSLEKRLEAVEARKPGRPRKDAA